MRICRAKALAAARDAARAGLVIYTVGVGTPAGDLVPVERDGVRDVMRDADGSGGALAPRRARRCDSWPSRRAAPTRRSGRRAAGSRPSIASTWRSCRDTRSRSACTRSTPSASRFRSPSRSVACSLELGSGRAAPTADWRSRAGLASRAVGALGGCALFDRPSSATGLARLARTKPPTEALTATPGEASVSTYNDGTAAYRKKDFPSAQRQFQDATHTTDIAMQEDAYYDLGNARYRLGQASLAKDRPAAIEAWKSARRGLRRRARASAQGRRRALQPRSREPTPGGARGAATARAKAADQEAKDQKNQQNQKGQQEAARLSGRRRTRSDQHGQKGQQGSRTASRAHQASNSPNGEASAVRARAAARDKPAKAHKSRTGASRIGSADGAEPQAGANQRDRDGTGAIATSQGQRGHGAHPPSRQQRSRLRKVRGSSRARRPTRRQGAAVGRRRNPGALSANEAEQLLDSVAGELRRMPVAGTRRQPASADDPHQGLVNVMINARRIFLPLAVAVTLAACRGAGARPTEPAPRRTTRGRRRARPPARSSRSICRSSAERTGSTSARPPR